MSFAIPTFFCIGVLVWLGLRELRKWVEVLVTASANSGGDEKTDDEPMSDSVKHMYN